MTDNDQDTTDDTITSTARDVTIGTTGSAASSTYKVRGKHAAADGTGVLGENTAGSGTPVGVEGRVPNAASNGYGLYTPDNAMVERILVAGGAEVLGDLVATSVLTIGNDFVVEAGTTSTNDATNVVLGHESNTATSGTVGAVVGGGGYDDGTTGEPNTVYDNYGTIAGGRNNTTGTDNGDPTVSDYATVGGGQDNEALAAGTTVAGGRNNTASNDRATVGGGFSNEAKGGESFVGGGFSNTVGSGSFASSIAGGSLNTVTDNREKSTIGGGWANEVRASYATVAGGAPSDTTDSSTIDATKNVVHDDYGTIAGGGNNQAGSSGSTDAVYATVGGGKRNTANADHTTVGGGSSNDAHGSAATIGGGNGNRTATSGVAATVAGGRQNSARRKEATVGGGGYNTAHGKRSTIGGGNNNRTGKSGTNKGEYATVPGGLNNVAEGDFAFAAGQNANAVNNRTFLWSSTSNEVSSTGPKQFLVDAPGGVGVGTTSPKTQLHVAESIDAGGSLKNHVAAVENTATSGGGDVLALKVDETGDIESDSNFVTFINGDGTNLGAIEGDGNGGVTNASAGSDYAEYLPQANPDEPMDPGDVVGVHAGEISLRTADADRAMVVTRQPVVAGNDPGPDAAARQGHQQVAFVGQTPVTVRGPVATGDLIIPSGEGDGTARAVTPEEWIHSDGPLIGCAWEDDDADGATEVTVAVGLETGEALAATVADQQTTIDQQQTTIDELRTESDRKDDRIAALEDETDDLEAENDALRDRLTTLEDRVSAVETADAGGPTPADD